ncbi:MAG: DNA-binding response regulator [Cycloclasticus sp. symbiont of Bathymodiolus heckerae]|nr:MAG: DNA-binding response regulator [Cycloclasticus sp. symbiont of Bathymodiolus heckerae]
MNRISLLLVDDHAVVRAGYRQLIATLPHIHIVGESDTAEKACQMYSELKPDVVVMDLSLPGMTGLEAIRRITALDKTAAIMAFSIHDELMYLERALQAGAKGYLTKSCDPCLLLKGIEELARGRSFVDPVMLKKKIEKQRGQVSSDIAQLSAREFDVYGLLIKGKRSKDIAGALFISQKTVANYATQIKLKLGVKTIAELSHLAGNSLHDTKN